MKIVHILVKQHLSETPEPIESCNNIIHIKIRMDPIITIEKPKPFVRAFPKSRKNVWEQMINKAKLNIKLKNHNQQNNPKPKLK